MTISEDSTKTFAHQQDSIKYEEKRRTIMAEDARTRYTKMMIKNSFIQLVQEKPFAKITLKEVCSLAGINHSTGHF